MEWFLYSWPTLILLGLALRMALRLNYGARGPDQDDPVYIFINTASWVLILLGLTPIALLGGLTVFGSVILILAAATLVEGVLARRAAQRRSMCTLLALVVDRGQQLESSILVASETVPGKVGRAMRRFFDALQCGMPLAAAAERYPAALPREAVAYLAAGDTMRAEAAALKELARNDREELVATWRTCIDRIVYLAFVLTFLSAVLLFLMVRIVPEFHKIFDEFGSELPALTTAAIALSQWTAYYLALPLILLLPLVVAGAALVAICYLLDWPVLARLADRVFCGRRAADVLRILAVATEHRQSLDVVLQRLANAYPSGLIRRQLGQAAAAIAGGEDWRAALRRSRFITPAEQALLATAESVGNLPWVLRTLAERKERRTVQRMAVGVQVLYPCAILALASLVGFFVVALFVPLVSLIHGLA